MTNRLGPTTTTDEAVSGVDLRGHTALVTGATSGLGAETARALAGAGARVILAARDVDAAAAVCAQIRQTVEPADLRTVALDLADLASVRAAAARVSAENPRLDLLVNNAGVMYTPFGRTRDGFELQFGTNHLGHFLLTTLLLPSLEAGAVASGSRVRVVTVSSDAHLAHAVDLDDPHFERRPYDKFVAYAQSKSANVLMTAELDRRYRDRGIRAFAVHPGVCATGLARHMSRDDFAEMKRMSAGKPGLLTDLKSIPQAAATTVWAATAGELDGRGGEYLADCGRGLAAAHATDADTARALWDLSVELTGTSSASTP